MNKENEIQSSTPKALIYMKEDLRNSQSQNTKTGCSILELMVLVTITPLQEGKFFANGCLLSMDCCFFIRNIYCSLFGLV